MKCDRCGCQFSICDKCGMSVLLGSSSAEHYMKCAWGNPVFACKDGGYLPWEAPGGECPQCWNKENGRGKPVLADSPLGRRIKEVTCREKGEIK